MKQFEKEISWVTWEYDPQSTAVDEKDRVKEVTHTKTVTFYDLNRTDKRQHKLHFRLISLFEGTEGSIGDPESIDINTDGFYDITVKAFKTLVIVDGEKFTKTDLEEFLNDSGAILPFGMWMLKEKFSPFFKNFL